MIESIKMYKDESRADRGFHWAVEITQDGVTSVNFYETSIKASAFMVDFVEWHAYKGFMK